MKSLNVIFDDSPAETFPGHNKLRRIKSLLSGRTDARWSGMRTVVANFLLGLRRCGVSHNFSSVGNGRAYEVNRVTISFGIGRY